MNFQSDMRGLVHVGANTGQEVESYVENGLSPILLFEPNLLHWNELATVRNRNRSVIALPVALGDKDETRKLWIPKRLNGEGLDDLSASFRRADRASGYAWGERDRDGFDMEVDVNRFDTIAKTFISVQETIDKYNVLVVDVQGFEYEVLVGFGDYLKQFKYLQIECSEPPIYLGGKSTSEIANYLGTFGLYQVSPTVNHGDVFFEGAG